MQIISYKKNNNNNNKKKDVTFRCMWGSLYESQESQLLRISQKNVTYINFVA